MTGLTYQKDVFARLYGSLEATRGLVSYIRATQVPVATSKHTPTSSATDAVAAVTGGTTESPTTLSTLQLLIECDHIQKEITSSNSGGLVSCLILHPIILEAVLNEQAVSIE